MALVRVVRNAVAVGVLFVSLGTADEESPVTMDESEIVRLLTEGFGLYVWPNHVFDGATVRIRLDCSFPDELRQWLSRVGESDGPLPDYQWRLDVTDASSENSPHQTLIYPVALGTTEASLDSAPLSAGLYRVQPSIVLPDGSSHRLWREPSTQHSPAYALDRFLAVHDGPVPTVQSRIVDGPCLLTGLRLLGTPGRVQYPGNDAGSCQGRSIRDMQLHLGAIYIGIGRGGPVDIWSFDPQQEPVSLKREISVDEETVHMIREIEGRLFVPGNNATESWDFGNLYIKEDGEWRKLRTVPNGIHVLGVEVHQGRLYVTTGTGRGPTLYESDDDGETWKRYDAVEEDGRWDWRFYEVGMLGEDLVLTVLQEYVYRFRRGRLTRVITPVFPNLDAYYTAPVRVTAFMDGLLYAAGEWWQTHSPKPLYYMTDLDKGAAVVGAFEDRSVRDILVRDGTCYVLTSTEQESGYASEVFSTRDLRTWTRIARFSSAAIASSLERLGGCYFVGMGVLREMSIPEAGNIYVLQP